MTFTNTSAVATAVDEFGRVGIWDVRVLDGWLRSTAAAVLVLIICAGIFGNSLVCLAVYYAPCLRTGMNALIVNLAVADLISCCVCLPIRLTIVVLDHARPESTLWACYIHEFMFAVGGCAQLVSLAFISFERYQAIARPFDKSQRIRRIKFGLVFSWIVGVVLGVLSLTNFNYSPFMLRCKYYRYETTYYTYKYGLYVIVPIGFSAISMILVMYCKIIYCVKKHVENTMRVFGKQNKVHAEKTAVRKHSTDDKTKLQVTSARSVDKSADDGKSKTSRDPPPIPHKSGVGDVYSPAHTRVTRDADLMKNKRSNSLGCLNSRQSGAQTAGPTCSLFCSTPDFTTFSQLNVNKQISTITDSDVKEREMKTDSSVGHNNRQETSETLENNKDGFPELLNKTGNKHNKVPDIVLSTTHTGQMDHGNQNVVSSNVVNDDELKEIKVQDNTILLGVVGDKSKTTETKPSQAGKEPNGSPMYTLAVQPTASIAVDSVSYSNVSNIHGERVIKICDMDGAQKEVKVQDKEIAGDICVMNPKNKVRGKRRLEAKTSKKAAIVIVTFLFCWLPLPISIIVCSGWALSLESSVKVNDTYLLAFSTAALSGALNPIVYAFVNKQFRIEYKKLLKQCKLKKH